MSLFDVPQITNNTDQSLYYLNIIFGPMNGVIAPQDAGTTTLTILGTMFQTFNTVMLAIGAFMIVYVTVVGVMRTAHEGEFMGKNWSNMWLPLRTVLGVASLVPTSSGYSGLQIIMMWVIVQGIGAADMVWNSALGYVQSAGSVTKQLEVAAPGPPIKANPGDIQTNQALKSLFRGMVCYKSAVMSAANPGSASLPAGQTLPYYCSVPANQSDSICTANTDQFSPSVSTLTATGSYMLGPTGGYCGQLTLCNAQSICQQQGSQSLECLSCQAQITAFAQIIPAFATIAEKYVKADYDYMQYYYASIGGGTPQPKPPQWLRDFCNSSVGQQSYPNCKGLPSPNPNDQGPPAILTNTLYWPWALMPTVTSAEATEGGGTFVQAASQLSANMVSAAISDQLAKQATVGPTGGTADCATSPNTIACAAVSGWIYAGAYYYVVALGNNGVASAQAPTITYAFPNQVPTSNTNKMYNYRNYYSAATDLLTAVDNATVASGSGSGTGTGSGTGSGTSSSSASNTSISSQSQSANAATSNIPGASDLTSSISDGATTASSGFAQVLNGQGDPIANLQYYGKIMLIVAEAVFWATILIFILLGLGWLAGIGLGTGITVNPIGPMAMMMEILFVPILFFGLGLCITYGGMLAIYLPLIPYIIFTMGAIGWMTSTIEAMVAGPLVAIGIISPSGHHELLGKAEPAIMLLFNTMIRPTLMIFGMIAAMLLATVAMKMVNALFWPIVEPGLVSGGTNSLGFGTFGFLLLLGAYISLTMSVLNKCFAAIHIIPEKVTRWIGSQGESYGESDAVSAAKQGIGDAGETAKGMASGARSSAGKAGEGVSGNVDKQVAANKKRMAEEAEARKAKMGKGGDGTPPESGG